MSQDERRERRYTLYFDNREPETIVASSAPEAVALREGGPLSRQPYQITDETAMEDWRRQMTASDRRQPSTPMLDRIYGAVDAPVDETTPRFTAREL